MRRQERAWASDRISPRSAAYFRLHPAVGDRGVRPRFLLAIALASGCAIDDGDYHLGTLEPASTVADHVGSTGCSTEVVLGLSRQISDEVQCIEPDILTRFEEGDGIVFAGSAVLPYLTPGGKSDLIAAVNARGGELRIN